MKSRLPRQSTFLFKRDNKNTDKGIEPNWNIKQPLRLYIQY